LDVIEKVNLLVGANGTILRSEIDGSIQVNSVLSGMPELRLGLNDRLQFSDVGGGRAASRGAKTIEMEDVKFHKCVSLSRFESDRIISFVPPDGEFELLSYRLTTNIKPLFWIEATVESHAHSRIEYLIKAKSQFKLRSVANDVKITIPVPPDADSPKFRVSPFSSLIFFFPAYFLAKYRNCKVCSRKRCHHLVYQTIYRRQRIHDESSFWPPFRN
jgi:AP-1 complex subunit mu